MDTLRKLSILENVAVAAHYGTNRRNGRAEAGALARRVLELVGLPTDQQASPATLGAGGLKKLEARMGLTRPGAVHGVDGWEAVMLWRHWCANRDVEALCKLVEYNLYDAIQLRPLLDLGYNRLVAQSGVERPLMP